MPKTNPAYAPEFRQKMVELVRSGRTYAALAKEFGVSDPSIRSWVRKANRVENLDLRIKVVNVASVPHRSVFRYPGGKTWFIPTLRRWIHSLDSKPKTFIEPFAGGAIAGLTVAFENLAEKVVLIELDDQVSSVWHAILGKDNSKLAKKILEFKLSKDSVLEVLDSKPRSTIDRAFQTILKNRVSHAGIMAPGAGIMKSGEGGRGLASRWYADTLSKRILEIQKVSDKIDFIEGSAFDYIPQYTGSSKNIFFVDPPYTAAGKNAGTRLYRHYQLDHDELFSMFSKSKADFLFTYDDNDELRNKAKSYGYMTSLIAMKNSHHAKMTELIVGKDLMWIQNL